MSLAKLINESITPYKKSVKSVIRDCIVECLSKDELSEDIIFDTISSRTAELDQSEVREEMTKCRECLASIDKVFKEY